MTLQLNRATRIYVYPDIVRVRRQPAFANSAMVVLHVCDHAGDDDVHIVEPRTESMVLNPRYA